VNRFVQCLAVAICLVPRVASAQDPSHWGVVVSISPEHSWRVIPELGEVVFTLGESVEARSTDFKIGIARGRDLGGDWGVSYVRKNVEDGSRFGTTTELCTGNNASQCATVPSDFALTRGVVVSGVEVHKFVPFVTIKRRAQIGMNFAGGVAKWEGDLEYHEFNEDFTFDPRTGQPSFRRTEAVTTRSAKELPAYSPWTFGKVEVAGAAILAPGFKVRVSGGFDFPGYTVFSLTGVVLFGAR
jgi:hypothetical protein